MCGKVARKGKVGNLRMETNRLQNFVVHDRITANESEINKDSICGLESSVLRYLPDVGYCEQSS
jgi:hypothetical protein